MTFREVHGHMLQKEVAVKTAMDPVTGISGKTVTETRDPVTVIVDTVHRDYEQSRVNTIEHHIEKMRDVPMDLNSTQQQASAEQGESQRPF